MHTNNSNYLDPTFVDIEEIKWVFEVDNQHPFFTNTTNQHVVKFRNIISEFTLKKFKNYEDAYQALGLFILACIRNGATFSIKGNHTFSVEFWHGLFKDDDFLIISTNFKFKLNVILEE